MNSMNPDAPDPLREIKRAFEENDSEQVRRLLDRYPAFKAMINEPVGPFDSPAIVNARSREMLDVLLAAGADLDAKSTWWAGGFGLLHLAPPELAAYAIERGARVDVHAAARLGMLEELQEHVAHDPQSIHARGGDGQTPLHFAATVDVAAFLLDRGADIDALDVDHESTPVQHMIDDRQEIVRYLISRGCRTDILMAATLGDVDLARRLLDADPESIRMRVSDEYFPMIGGKAGGTIYQWTLGWYVSAHQVARKYGHEETLEFLLERSPAAVRLLDACWMADETAAKRLLAEHPNLADELNDAESRHVAHAARNNETEIVRLMLECGLPANATSQHGATALHWAAWHGNLEMTGTLLRFAPPMEATDAEFGATPLGWAIHGSENGWYCRTGNYAATVEALLEAGAKRPSSIEGTTGVRDVLRRWQELK